MTEKATTIQIVLEITDLTGVLDMNAEPFDQFTDIMAEYAGDFLANNDIDQHDGIYIGARRIK